MLHLKNYAFIVFVLLGMTVNAQNNVIKAGLTGAFLGDINIGFEQRVSDKSSLQVKIGFLDPTLSPAVNEDVITPKAYTLLEANGGISTSLEYRFYLSRKRGLQGFYVAPYLRYFNQKMLFDDEIEGYIFLVDSKLSTVGMGAQLGYQWIINEIFALDFFFFGTGADFHKAELKYKLDPQPSGFDYSIVTPHVDDVFVDINYLHSKLTHTVNEDNHNTKLPFLFPGFRAGISIGVAF
ncbi:MAG: DUF3575 domain-containing protein [Mariniphaga sp.]